MAKKLFEGHFQATYHLAQVINDMVAEPFAYLRELEAFYSGDNYIDFIKPFPRYSALHQLAEFITTSYLEDEMTGVDISRLYYIQRHEHPHSSDLPQLPINQMLKSYGIQHTSFREWLDGEGKLLESVEGNDVDEYYQELFLTGAANSLAEYMAEEVFYIMFWNRAALKNLNKMIADLVITSISIDDLEPEEKRRFQGDGMLKPVDVPNWVRQAVFFRERGRCATCNRKISELLSVQDSKQHYDYMIPLADGGLNDVTNIYLICEKCLRRKPSDPFHYERWY